MRLALAHPAVVVVAVALTFWATWQVATSLDSELLPEVHQGEFTVEVALPVGTPLEETDEVLQPVEEAILAERGTQPGLFHVFSAMEPCSSFRPWHDKTTHRTQLKPDSGKCLHYYFYFIDEDFGLCYLRVPTWAPFRLQVYFNGHSWLAQQLGKAGIACEMAGARSLLAELGEQTGGARGVAEVEIDATVERRTGEATGRARVVPARHEDRGENSQRESDAGQGIGGNPGF